MYNLVQFLAVVALLGSACHSSNVNRHMKMLSDMDNNINSNAVHTKASTSRKFVSLTRRPASSYSLAAGATLDLTCDAVGSPAPNIHWFKNDAPVYEFDMESNELIDSNPTSIARVTSTLLVTSRGRDVTSSGRDADVYTCLVTAAGHSARAETLVSNAVGSTELSERARLYPLAPRVVVSYKVYVDVIGARVALPCRAKGHPRPRVVWRDNNGNPLNDPRIKVLRSGELVLSSLRWSDMGEWSCRAYNVHGHHQANTFIYPAKAG